VGKKTKNLEVRVHASGGGRGRELMARCRGNKRTQSSGGQKGGKKRSSLGRKDPNSRPKKSEEEIRKKGSGGKKVINIGSNGRGGVTPIPNRPSGP